jgi:3-methyladenine DNA glycosylase AlkD
MKQVVRSGRAATATELRRHLCRLGSPEAAAACARFFKTGPGQYGEGDVFLGIPAAPLFQLAREHHALPMREVAALLHSAIHEERSLALLVLVESFARSPEQIRKTIYDFYLDNTRWINNWDLVDSSARSIVGQYLERRSRKPLYRLARSPSLWERRISIVATHHFIRQNDFSDTFKIAELLLNDREDLIHKATGWMLREIGKRNEMALELFLKRHHAVMPRTTLRYAIERFAPKKRRSYLDGQPPRS